MAHSIAHRIQIIAEDTPHRLLLSEELISQGYLVTCHNTVDLTISSFASDQMDLVLLDTSNLSEDGIASACQLIRTHAERALPLIVFSSTTTEKTINTALSAGATDFLPKPVSLLLLRNRVHAALGSMQCAHKLQKAHHTQQHAFRLAGIRSWTFDRQAETLHSTGPNFEGEHPAAIDELDLMPYIHPGDVDHFLHIMAALSNQSPEVTFEFRLCLPKAGVRTVHATGNCAPHNSRFVEGVLHDVTEQKSNEEMLHYVLQHDDLTGLPNKRALIQTSPGIQHQARESNHVVMLSVVTFRELGQIIAAFGQRVADRLIQLFGEELNFFITNKGTSLYYLSEGRFALLMTNHLRTEIEQTINNMLEKTSREWLFDGRQILLRTTASMVELNESTAGIGQMLHIANSMLDHNLQHPDAAIHWYDNTLLKSGVMTLEFENSVKKAVRDQEFCLFYQPLVNLLTGDVVGVEALVRWPDKNNTHRLPGEFLPIIEQLGLMGELGKHVLRLAFQQAKAFQLEKLNLTVSINLAAQQFLDHKLIDDIRQTMHDTGVKPTLIEFEITEGTAMANPLHTIHALSELRAMGFSVAIDDFGIGYSSFEYLLKFPATTLKIDRTFVHDLETDQRVKAIVIALVTMAQSLGLRTICEGIETEEQRKVVTHLGVDCMQGFLFSHPMAEQDIIDFLHSHYQAQ